VTVTRYKDERVRKKRGQTDRKDQKKESMCKGAVVLASQAQISSYVQLKMYVQLKIMCLFYLRNFIMAPRNSR